MSQAINPSNSGMSTQLRATLISYARKYIHSVLNQGVQRGQLQIIEHDNISIFGQTELDINQPKATLQVTDEAFWLRMFLSDKRLGLYVPSPIRAATTSNIFLVADSFMLGEVGVDNLKAIFEIWIMNATHLNGLSTILHQLFSAFYSLTSTLFGQNISRARLNVTAGYDVSNTMFQAFLSQEMMYSCALWTDDLGGINGDLAEKYQPGSNLELAQKAKIDHVLANARVKPRDRILEIGSGWCGFAIQAATKFGCSVDTLTLSPAQKMLGEARIRAAGLESLITVHLLDYRCLPPSFESAFDALISIEMIEHVGTRHYAQYFQVVDWALKKKRSTAVITSATRAEARYTTYQAPDFCRYYVWPNGAHPSPTALIKAANDGSQGRLVLNTVENHAEHYPRTLREWNIRFETNMTDSIRQQIIDENPELADPTLFETFKRKWLYLFPYSEAGFNTGYLGCHMLTFGRDVL
ncbi:cyclopropane-fatty-acyl-phospholipid synthase [Mycena leptocephala]|nr:cyclopropane-fatty-acyl-phospholipid synthase [Mycena leptocephala]